MGQHVASEELRPIVLLLTQKLHVDVSEDRAIAVFVGTSERVIERKMITTAARYPGQRDDAIMEMDTPPA
jgi:hypothetical protein